MQKIPRDLVKNDEIAAIAGLINNYAEVQMPEKHGMLRFEVVSGYALMIDLGSSHDV